MKPKVFITRKIPDSGLALLRQYCQVRVHPRDEAASREELLKGAGWCQALLCLLTDSIDGELIAASPTLRVIATPFTNAGLHASEIIEDIRIIHKPEKLAETVRRLIAEHNRPGQGG